jgi:hypothetical protein
MIPHSSAAILMMAQGTGEKNELNHRGTKYTEIRMNLNLGVLGASAVQSIPIEKEVHLSLVLPKRT